MDKIVKSDAEWRAQLSDMAYKVTRKHSTERAGTHEDFPKDAGTYMCVCCGAPLFDQGAKKKHTLRYTTDEQRRTNRKEAFKNVSLICSFT